MLRCLRTWRDGIACSIHLSRKVSWKGILFSTFVHNYPISLLLLIQFVRSSRQWNCSTDILPQRPIKYIYLSCKLLVPDLFQQIVFKLWHLVPLPSVDCRDSQDQPDKHHLGASTHSCLINFKTVDLKRVLVYNSHFANFVNWKISSLSFVKGFEIRKIIFYSLCKCIIRVVINL